MNGKIKIKHEYEQKWFIVPPQRCTSYRNGHFSFIALASGQRETLMARNWPFRENGYTHRFDGKGSS